LTYFIFFKIFFVHGLFHYGIWDLKK